MKKLNSENIIKIGNLIPTGVYSEPLSRYSQVLNFQAEDKVVSLCTPLLCTGPFRIILKIDDLDEIHSFCLSESEIILNDEIRLAFSPQQLFKQPRIQPALVGTVMNALMVKLMKELLEQNEESLLRFLIDPPSKLNRFQVELAKCFHNGIRAHYQKDYIGFVNHIKGRGMGSTPSGDDFIIGYLIGLSWLIQAWGMNLLSERDTIYQTALGSNALINTFLYQAYTYQLDKSWSDFLNSLAGAKINRVLDDFYNVLAQGESSGADMLSGFYYLLLDKISEALVTSKKPKT